MPAQSRQRNTVSLFIVITDFEKKCAAKVLRIRGNTVRCHTKKRFEG
jgi:hypothetical protein